MPDAIFESLVNPTPEATIVQLGSGDKRTTLVFGEDAKNHPGVGDAVKGLQASVANVAGALAREAPNLSDAGFRKAATDRIDRELRPKFQLAQEAAHRALADVERRWSDLSKPRFAEQSVPAVRAEQRAFARSLSLPKLLDAAKADPLLAGAIIEGGVAMSGLPADVFERLKRAMAVDQLAETLARQHNFRTQPSAGDPVAGLPDFEAARRAAELQIESLETEREMLGRIAPLLAGVVVAVSLMTGEALAEAFTRLTAR